MSVSQRVSAVTAIAVLVWALGGLPVAAQAPAQIIRAVMTKEEGRILLLEVDTFLTRDTKAVCWVRVVPSLNRRTISFHWVTPSGDVFRVSSALPMLPGDDVIWDVVPIRDSPIERLRGLWRVDIFVDGQFATRVYFRVLPPPPRLPVTTRFETVLNHNALHIWRPSGSRDVLTRYVVDQRVELNAEVGRADLTVRVAGGLTAGESRGASRVSFVVGVDHPAGIALFVGREAQTVQDRPDPERPSALSTNTFLDFRFASPQLPSFGLSLSRVDRSDGLTPALTSDTETTASVNLSYSRLPWTIVLVHTQNEVDDRTLAEPFTRSRSTGGSLIYAASPSLTFLGTHISTYREEGPLGGVGPFTFNGTSSILRASLSVSPALTLGATYGVGGSSRSDGLFDVQTRLIGGEVTYLLSRTVTLRAGYQTDAIDLTAAGITTRLSSTTLLGTIEYRPNPRLFVSVSYLPSRADVVFGTPGITTSLTGVLSYYPSPRFGVSVTYNNIDTSGTAPLSLQALSVSLRYDIRPELVLTAVAQRSRQRFAATPASDFDALFYSLGLSWKY
jgi:hypothetical protein